MFVCEADCIPSHWVEICNRFNLILVPSQYCKSVFIACGVDVPVLVVNHDLDPEFVPRGKTIGNRFIFFNSFNAASFVHRKSCEELVRCFMEAFGDRDDVRLLLHTGGGTEIPRIVDKYNAGDSVSIEARPNLSNEEIAALYHSVHCTIHPSKAEGFGMVPLQSIATNTPVIAPFITGMTEYVNSDNAIKLHTTHRIQATDGHNTSGNYFAIDEQHLVGLMRYVEANWANEYAKVCAASASIRERFISDNVYRQLARLLTDLANNPNPEQINESLPETA